MRRLKGSVVAVLMLILAIGSFASVLYLNSTDRMPLAPILPTQMNATADQASVSQLLDENFGANITPLPTVELLVAQPTRPIVAQPLISPTPINAADIPGNQSNQRAANVPLGATPTLPPPTADAPVLVGTIDPDDWNLPALVPPLSRDPRGRDHYWFHRPIESNANNAVLMSYTYGASGFFGSRIHHGIDMPNPILEEVYAPADGLVVFAADGRGEDSTDVFETRVYGNVVVLKHDFGYDGQPLYSLYAHLQTALVTENDRVQAGDPIGLVGRSGTVTGAHLHFEIRMGGDGQGIPRYGDTYNPTLWMVPYVNHGIVAGRVIDSTGDFVDNVVVTIRNQLGVVASVPTYIFADTVNDVNPDPLWRENFAVGDIQAGTYEVLVRINGQLVIERVQVREGMTNFVVLQVENAILPTVSPTPATTVNSQSTPETDDN